MKRFLLGLLTAALSCTAVPETFAEAESTFDIAIKVQGESATGEARCIEKINLDCLYRIYNLNTSNTEPITISLDEEVIESFMPDDRRLIAIEDDWGDVESYMISLSHKLNRVGEYSIYVPEGFFISSGIRNAAASHFLNIVSPMPSTLEISGDGVEDAPVVMSSEDTRFIASVKIIGNGSLKFIGDDTYYGTTSESAELPVGAQTAIGYQGKNFIVPAGSYAVELDWSDGNPMVTFNRLFDLSVKVQGANESGLANAFQRVNFDASYVSYGLNTVNDMPIVISRNGKPILTINNDNRQLIPVDEDDDWEDDAYMLSLSEKINRAGRYTVSVPQGFFKSSAGINAEAKAEVSLISGQPSALTLRGDIEGHEREMEFESPNIFTANEVKVYEAGEVDLMGDTWYGAANGQAVITQGEPAPIGYQGVKWTVPAGLYDVRIEWIEEDPVITFSLNPYASLNESDYHEGDGEYYNLQGMRISTPENGSMVLKKSLYGVKKIIY